MPALPQSIAADALPPMHVTVQGDVHVHVHADPNPTNLTQLEQNILEALGDGILLTKDLAERAGYKPDSHFRGVLVSLCKRGLLVNRRPGYQRPGKS